jgi:hypothetical protein
MQDSNGLFRHTIKLERDFFITCYVKVFHGLTIKIVLEYCA